jgi:hypothetical protein
VHLQISGTTERPRLAVFRSNNHIYAQVGGPVHCTRQQRLQGPRQKLLIGRPPQLSGWQQAQPAPVYAAVNTPDVSRRITLTPSHPDVWQQQHPWELWQQQRWLLL